MNEKLKSLYANAGFKVTNSAMSDRPSVEPISEELEYLIKIVIAECALTAALQSRSYSDGNAGMGCAAASDAVRLYGENLFKE